MGLAAVALLGLGLRAYAIAATPVCPNDRDTGGCYVYGGDSYEYWNVAVALSRGEGFHSLTEATAHHPPAYSLYLAAVAKLGLQTVDEFRYASALLGSMVLVAVGLVGRLVGGRKVGLLAAALAAVYPAFWINDIVLMSEPMATLAACGCILAGYRLWRERTVGAAALLGVAGGFAGLCRSEGPVIVSIAAVSLVAGMMGVAWLRRVKLLAVTGVLGALVLAPWLIRNALAFEHPVSLTSTAGQSLFLTNRPATYYGGDLGSKSGFRELDGRKAEMFGRDQSVLNEHLKADVRPFMNANRGRLPVVMLARFGREWNLYRPFDTVRTDQVVERRGHLPSLAGLWAFWVLGPLAIAGGFILFRRRVVLSPLLAVVAAAMLAGIANFGATRYRAGAEVTIVVLASVALVAIKSEIGRRRKRTLSSAERAVERESGPRSSSTATA